MLGFQTWNVEKMIRIPPKPPLQPKPSMFKRDAWYCTDVIAVHPECVGVLHVQITSRKNHEDRMNKIEKLWGQEKEGPMIKAVVGSLNPICVLSLPDAGDIGFARMSCLIRDLSDYPRLTAKWIEEPDPRTLMPTVLGATLWLIDAVKR